MSRETRSAKRPATFGEVLANREFRGVYFAAALSVTGDATARAAVTALVYHRTGSLSASAAAFAVGFLPWLLGGPLLAALAERYPHRTTMVLCDVGRAMLIAVVAIPHLPISAILVLLFCTALLNPPFEASRSAQAPQILTGDQYVVGLALLSSTTPAAQVVGYGLGAIIAGFSTSAALLIDSATFVASALLIGLLVRLRPPTLSRTARSHLLRETGQGFRLVFGSPVLRSIALTVLAVALFPVTFEGLGAAWAGKLTHTTEARSLAQSLIMLSVPLGFFIGGLTVGRLVNPVLRRRLIRPFAALCALCLVPAMIGPPVWGVALCGVSTAFCAAGMVPASNGLFVMALPRQFRARAFGVVQTGIQLTQGTVVMLVGVVATHVAVWSTIGVLGLVGFVLIVLIGLSWPKQEVFDQAVEAATSANAEGDAAASAAGPTTGRMRTAESV